MDVDVEKDIREILNPLQVRRQTLEQEIAELQSRLDAARGALRRIDRIMVAANPELKKTRGKPSNDGQLGEHARQRMIERADEILTLMKRREKKPDWMLSELAVELRSTTGTLRRSTDYLREQGKIRVTRKVKGGGQAYAPFPQ